MKVSILSIGTELTDGQIVNRNAAWISKKLKEVGVSTALHLAVPDQKNPMLQGLQFCAQKSEVIFVTGGLGPTSDDFTRDVIGEWMGVDLEFHDASWKHLHERLTSRGYEVKEIQRQQCYFPLGAEILFNSEGTANGFRAQAHQKTLFVLPGPPREIEAIWKSHIAAWLVDNTRNLDPIMTRTWDTMGKGESDIALLTEPVLKGIDVEIGYRVHLPYVEVKVTHLQSQTHDLEPTLAKLSQVLAPFTQLRDGADAAEQFAKLMVTKGSLAICDNATSTYLWQRLVTPMRSYMTSHSFLFTNSLKELNADVTILLTPLGPHSAECALTWDGVRYEQKFTSPYTTQNMLERSKQFFAEMALLYVLEKANFSHS